MQKLISWVEIPSIDFNRAVDFYQKVFNLQLEIFDEESEKMGCFPSGEGAVIYSEGYVPSDQGVIVSFNAGDDLDGTLKRVKENEGLVIVSKTKIEAKDRGYFAIFMDCEGNRLGLYGNP